ncbi:hypothetical protein [Streptomyces violascens]|uniref:hypothetical protein n=1 Tax=Streptomyces violascens TaxID=67381 RepID=UPI0036B6517C
MTVSLEPGSPSHRLHLSQLAIYLRHSRQILAAWDLYSDRHSDPETFQPHEDAYSLRQQKRDADTLSAFGLAYPHADELVHVGERQLAQLSPSDRTHRYAWQVRELREATERLYAAHDEWLALRRALPKNAVPGTEAFDEPLAESYAGAWSPPRPVGHPRPGPHRPPPGTAPSHHHPGTSRQRPYLHSPLISIGRSTILFDHTAHREHLQNVGHFVRDSKEILDAWDAYSDECTDLYGWPYDEHTYGLRQSERDAETAEAFEDLRASARHLLATAAVQLKTLPATAVQNRWGYQLGVLQDALERLDTLHEEWLTTRDSLPADARPGTPAFDDAIARYHAEAWSYLDDWATHSQALVDIDSAAQRTPSPLAPAPAATAVPAPGRTAAVRR